MKQLMTALFEAQKELRTVVKDAVQKHHGYRYASTEQIVGDAVDVLHKHGLVVMAGTSRFDHEKQVARTSFIVMHPVAGEEKEFEFEVPVYVDKGRPVDKAYLGSVTGSIGYFLRGLIMFQREDPSTTIDGRNDTAFEPGKAVIPSKEAAVTRGTTMGAQQAQSQPQATQSGQEAFTEAKAEALMRGCADRQELQKVAVRIGQEIKEKSTQLRLADIYAEMEAKLK